KPVRRRRFLFAQFRGPWPRGHGSSHQQSLAPICLGPRKRTQADGAAFSTHFCPAQRVQDAPDTRGGRGALVPCNRTGVGRGGGRQERRKCVAPARVAETGSQTGMEAHLVPDPGIASSCPIGAPASSTKAGAEGLAS